MKICSVEGCNNKVRCKGLCSKHYAQFRQYGHVLERTKRDLNEIIEYEDYAEIVLTNNKGEETGRAIIDLEYIDVIKDYKWHLTARGYVLNNKVGKLHKFIMNPSDDLVVDHINRNKLDNRRCNLRICSQHQNSMNKSKASNNTSGVSGVCWDKNSNKWAAYININKKRKFLGYFSTLEKAAEVRRQAEIEYYGEYAPTEE